jgi:protein TonB
MQNKPQAHHTHTQTSFEHLLAREREDRRTTPLGITAALVVHVLAFAMTWPSFAKQEVEPERVILRPIQLTQIEVPKPPPPSAVQPRKIPKKVPIPDPTPDEPEVVEREVEEPDLHFDDQLLDPFENIRVPTPPPELETTKVRVHFDVDPPRVLHRVPPQYTQAALHAHVEGPIVLELTIGTNGRVRESKVLRSLPLGLTEEAIKAVSQWQFEPCLYGGREVEVLYILTVNFRINR